MTGQGRTKDRQQDDSLPPAGTGWPPEAAQLPPGAAGATDDLSREIALMKALHPKLKVKFRDADLQAMSTQEKSLLLQDMRDALRIRPLAKSTL